MSSRLILLFALFAVTALAGDANGVRSLVCVGRVEPVDGEVEVSAQMSGTIVAVNVKEGDWVEKGAVLAELDAPREKAALDLAIARLARVTVGNGKEEIAAAAAERDAVAVQLELADNELKRAIKLSEQNILADDTRDEREKRASMLRKQFVGATNRAEAMKRGALPEEIALARAEVGTAQAAYDLRLVQARGAGAILHVHRHAGDFVTLFHPTPILRMADTKRLRVRIEVNEQEAHRVKPGLVGDFTVFGVKEIRGNLIMRTVLPSFVPRRLFEPDSTARMDTRTVNVLCEIQGTMPQIMSGQRIVGTFPLTEK